MKHLSRTLNFKSRAARCGRLLGLPPCTCVLLLIAACAATQFDDYVGRVAQAARQVTELAHDGNREETSEKAALQTLTELLPATENIARGGEVVHVDNSWLHQAVSNLNWDDDEVHATQLGEIAERLSALERRLRETQSTGTSQSTTPVDARERLQRILAREEYQPEVQKDSVIRAWLRKIQQAIDQFRIWLLTRNGPQSTPSGETVRLLRYLILGVTAAAALLAVMMLLRRFRWQALQRKKRETEAEREVLGESFDAAVTPEDLLRQAAEMARNGDFRLAIRRAYIALLCELEERGRLRLHRAKTNNDYLRELSREFEAYPVIVQMTNRYERVWYGHGEATLEDYTGFIDAYRAVAAPR